MLELNQEAKDGNGEGSSQGSARSLKSVTMKSLIPMDAISSKRQNFKLLIGFNKTMNEMKNTVKRAIRLYMTEKFKSKQLEDSMKANRDTYENSKKEKENWESERLLIQQRIMEPEFMTKNAEGGNSELVKYNEDEVTQPLNLKSNQMELSI